MTPDDWERIDAKVEEMKWAAVGVAAKAAAASHHYVNDLCRRLDVAELDPFSFNVANDDPVAKTTDAATRANPARPNHQPSQNPTTNANPLRRTTLMATAKQKAAARRNIRKAIAANRKRGKTTRRRRR
jgi:hypothetical protein